MKALMVGAIVVFAGVASVAFACATVQRDSEVAMHFVRDDEQFIRERINFIIVGTAALLLDTYLVWRLWRRRARRDGCVA